MQTISICFTISLPHYIFADEERYFIKVEDQRLYFIKVKNGIISITDIFAKTLCSNIFDAQIRLGPLSYLVKRKNYLEDCKGVPITFKKNAFFDKV